MYSAEPSGIYNKKTTLFDLKLHPMRQLLEIGEPLLKSLQTEFIIADALTLELEKAKEFCAVFLGDISTERNLSQINQEILR